MAKHIKKELLGAQKEMMKVLTKFKKLKVPTESKFAILTHKAIEKIIYKNLNSINKKLEKFKT
jgi:hypothetical protein